MTLEGLWACSSELVSWRYLSYSISLEHTLQIGNWSARSNKFQQMFNYVFIFVWKRENKVFQNKLVLFYRLNTNESSLPNISVPPSSASGKERGVPMPSLNSDNCVRGQWNTTKITISYPWTSLRQRQAVEGLWAVLRQEETTCTRQFPGHRRQQQKHSPHYQWNISLVSNFPITSGVR